ncbi:MULTISPECIES: amino acid ABC transporter permease [Halobacillus]|uniref:ABC-type transport system permease protein (Probable substrate amino acid) n=1 Tax=Halobacillus halophilus (strain ATCC 35676 / DSM 2266 / JCM 20832 / KCTC 3685 / LMG 17431 / NBRC 102448 / NCIMB 2269) TaxID=866895 RepID=I0JIG4_HALH3|nr:amino acid ABC transporter permease [Halobacillus halophilus]ASF38115.1 amino acid ABC transporter permease [Halobacillus halophilus]CCG43932.1 ABC-type transport system permease protein (probable substrate amino acid) [Halobacillus halophilus DSM 2266]
MKMFLLSSFLSSEDVTILQDSFLPLLKGVLSYTIPLTLISFAIGLILAITTALFRISGIKVLSGIARVYVSIIRGTPLLVQLFIVFYGLGNLGIEALKFEPFVGAIIAFSLNTGAYASETIRASILSIEKGQWEASSSIGMSYLQSLRRVILPQATRVSVPPLSNSFIGLVKETSLASTILVSEMFRKAQEIVATTYTPLLVYVEAGAIYWVICFLLSVLQGRIENRMNRYVKT